MPWPIINKLLIFKYYTEIDEILHMSAELFLYYSDRLAICTRSKRQDVSWSLVVSNHHGYSSHLKADFSL